jgi:hypothetical protein
MFCVTRTDQNRPTFLQWSEGCSGLAFVGQPVELTYMKLTKATRVKHT